MIRISISGREELTIKAIALDYNGTIAVDGQLIEEITQQIHRLCAQVDVYVLTADTYGNVQQQCRDLPVTVKTFPQAGAAACKEAIIRELGGGVCAVGNGFNDIRMFDAADLAVAVLDEEGICAALLAHADILVRTSADALELLLKPDRIRATLRT